MEDPKGSVNESKEKHLKIIIMMRLRLKIIKKT
jgi:hypothetical protein